MATTKKKTVELLLNLKIKDNVNLAAVNTKIKTLEKQLESGAQKARSLMDAMSKPIDSSKKTSQSASKLTFGKDVANDLAQAQKGLSDFQVALKKTAAGGMGEFVTKAGTLYESLEDLSERVSSLSERLHDMSQKYPTTDTEKFRNNVNGLSRELNSAQISFSRVLEEMNDTSVEQKNVSNNFKVLGSYLKTGFLAALHSVKKSIESITNILKRLQGSVQKSFETFSRLGHGLQNTTNKLIDAGRQLSQGFLSIGRSIMFFVSLPLAAFFKKASDAAFAFEQQMARIAKVSEGAFTTLLGGTSFLRNKFTDAILELSLVSLSSPTQLAEWAEQIAQMGVKSEAAVLNLLPIFELVSGALEVEGTNIASILGGIAAAFGKSFRSNAEEATEFVWRMSNVLNVLENNVGTTAGEIITSLSDIGPIVAALNIPPHIIATWAALGNEVGLSASEVGTSLKRLYTFFATRASTLENYAYAYDAVTQAQQRMIDSGELAIGQNISMDKAVTAVITKYAVMISQQEDVANILAEVSKLFGRQGQNMVFALSQQLDATTEMGESYEELLEKARLAYTETSIANSSLMQEYEIMANTASGALSRMSNAFEYLKVTVGQAVAPIVAELAETLIPIVRALGIEFSKLSDSVKKKIVIFIGLVAVLGPITFFLSQILFGFSLVGLGLMKLVGVFASAIGTIFAFGKSLLMLNPISWAVFIALVGLFKNIRQSSEGLAAGIGAIIKELISNAVKWGKSLFSSFADGIDESAGLVIRSVRNIVSLISQFIKSFSPPKRGELRHIDQWGKNVFDTYLEGMKDADFGILNDIGKTIEHILGTFVFLGDFDESEMNKLMMDYRQALAKLLADFNEFGSVSDGQIRAVTAGLGEQQDEIEGLIKQYIKLKRILLDIDALNRERDDIMSAYNTGVREIAVTEGGNLRDRYTMLSRLQQQRDKELFHVEEQLEIEEKRKAMQEEELKRIQSITDQQITQDTYEMGMFEVKVAGGGGVEEELLASFGAAFGDIEEKIKNFASIFASKLLELRMKVATFTSFVRTSLALLFDDLEDDLSSRDLSNLMGQKMFSPEEFQKYYDEVYNGIVGGFVDAEEGIKNVANTLGANAAMELFGALNYAIKSGDVEIEPGILQGIQDDLANMGDVDSWFDGGAIDTATGIVGEFQEAWQGVVDTLDGLQETGQGALDLFLDAFDGKEIDTENLTNFENFIVLMGQLADSFREHVPGIIDNIIKISENLGDLIGTEITSNKEGIAGAVDRILQFIKEVTGQIAAMEDDELSQAIGKMFTSLIVGGISFISVKAIFTALWAVLVQAVTHALVTGTLFTTVKSLFTGFFAKTVASGASAGVAKGLAGFSLPIGADGTGGVIMLGQGGAAAGGAGAAPLIGVLLAIAVAVTGVIGAFEFFEDTWARVKEKIMNPFQAATKPWQELWSMLQDSSIEVDGLGGKLEAMGGFLGFVWRMAKLAYGAVITAIGIVAQFAGEIVTGIIAVTSTMAATALAFVLELFGILPKGSAKQIWSGLEVSFYEALLRMAGSVDTFISDFLGAIEDITGLDLSTIDVPDFAGRILAGMPEEVKVQIVPDITGSFNQEAVDAWQKQFEIKPTPSGDWNATEVLANWMTDSQAELVIPTTFDYTEVDVNAVWADLFGETDPLSSVIIPDLAVADEAMLGAIGAWNTGTLSVGTNFGLSADTMVTGIQKVDDEFNNTLLPTLDKVIEKLSKINSLGGLAGLGWGAGDAQPSQTGGYMGGGHPTIVGETGPELFIPASSGFMHSFTQLASMFGSASSLGGGGNQFNTVINNNEKEVTARDLERIFARYEALYG